MVQRSIFISGTRSEAIQFLKKFISQTYGEIVKEDSRRILWTYKYYNHTIECTTRIVSHGKITEITTSSLSDDLWNKKTKAPITELYSQLHKEFEVVPNNEVVKKTSIKKSTKTKPINKPNSTNFKWWKIIFIGVFIIFSFYITNKNPGVEVKNNPWDDSVHQVERYLKNTLYYPDSFNPIMWSKVYDMNHNEYGYRYKVRVKYNAKNSYGVMITESQLFYLTEDGTIIKVE